jgi:hypothetical protein
MSCKRVAVPDRSRAPEGSAATEKEAPWPGQRVSTRELEGMGHRSEEAPARAERDILPQRAATRSPQALS